MIRSFRNKGLRNLFLWHAERRLRGEVEKIPAHAVGG